MVNLNENLIEMQNLTDDAVLELEILHKAREGLFDEMAKLDLDHDFELLQTYVILLESLEYNMQRVWKFTQDRRYHVWWCRVPHCTCGETIKCKLHSGFVKHEQDN